MTLHRLTMMTVGFVAASCVAACIIVMALLLISTSQSQFAIDIELVRTTTFLAALIAAFVAALGLFPFLIAVAYAERNSISSPTWYVFAGAVVGIVALGLNLLLTAPRGGINLSDQAIIPCSRPYRALQWLPLWRAFVQATHIG